MVLRQLADNNMTLGRHSLFRWQRTTFYRLHIIKSLHFSLTRWRHWIRHDWKHIKRHFICAFVLNIHKYMTIN